MPFIMQQQLHMPPWSIVHRFCTMLQAVLSSHEQVSFIPPEHFSTFIVQRGTVSQFIPCGTAAGALTGGVIIPGAIPATPVPVRSMVFVLDITELLSKTGLGLPAPYPLKSRSLTARLSSCSSLYEARWAHCKPPTGKWAAKPCLVKLGKHFFIFWFWDGTIVHFMLILLNIFNGGRHSDPEMTFLDLQRLVSR
jgi:hypothetical protein